MEQLIGELPLSLAFWYWLYARVPAGVPTRERVAATKERKTIAATPLFQRLSR